MKQSVNKTNSIVEGPIWKNMLIYFWALLLGAFFQQFYNTVDAVIVGRAVGSDGLAAVGGSAAMVVNLFVGFFMGLSSGATVVIAQFYGAGRKDEVKKAVHTAIAIAISGGIIITIIGLFISSWIIDVMKTPKEVIEASTAYLRIYFIGMVANLVYNMGAGILRAIGDSRRPLIVLIISCFVNIFLDIFFVIVLGMGKQGITQGVMGVAVATVICQLISAVIVVIMLMRSNDSYKLILKEIRIDPGMLKRIISIGLPAGVQSTMYTLSNVLIQASINEFGKDATAAWAAYGKIDVLFWMTISSLGTAATTFAGQNYGAGKYSRVRNSTRQAFFIAAVITTPLSAILYFWGKVFLYIFVDDANVISIGVQMIKFLAPFYVTYIAVEILSGVLRGMGTALVPMLITLSGICLLRVSWILLVFPQHRTIETVEASYPITWITTSVLFFIYYFYYVIKHHIGTKYEKTN
ncbi:MATE family efflux transporter [Butyrivibrio sp. YAB3001]|uniref:MATE family efflux transporter n=1 Tax=Butyrivibrio sp. YAB3001 TaxID=1520812 RepID=UPI0008F65C1F|nr:MATE family efflux transporter [Butyrivibrio sp. YAB3001]SFB86647.1 putative efflux protein, MATE family [Butyrivibrio sp. YAB3001]